MGDDTDGQQADKGFMACVVVVLCCVCGLVRGASGMIGWLPRVVCQYT